MSGSGIDCLPADEADAEPAIAACAVPKATVGLLSALPAVTVALGELLGARPLAFLLGSPRGVVCLVLGGCCYAAGLAWMRALLKGSGL